MMLESEMNMLEKGLIQFSIEKWKEGYEVVCRDGTAVNELVFLTSVKGSNLKLVGVCEGRIILWTESGQYYPDEFTSRYDLFLRPKMQTWYRRAYWIQSILQYKTSQDRNAECLQDNLFKDYETILKWAGPAEEFQVPARVK